MSLLNDMLRDLSHQRGIPDGVDTYDQELLQSTAIVKKTPIAWMSLITLFVVVFIGVFLLNYLLHHFRSSQELNVDRRSASVTASGKSKEDSKIRLVDTPSIYQASSNYKHVDDQSSKLVQAHVDDLLQQANRAIAMDRFTSPVEDNAYAYYEKILALSPDNQDARAGIDAIANRYLSLAKEQAQLGNKQQAEAYMQRAKFVSPDFVQMKSINWDAIAQNSESSSSANEQSDKQALSPASAPELVPTPVEKIKSMVVTEATTLSVAPTQAWKDDQVVQQAQHLLQQGKQTDALELLKQFVSNADKPIMSTILLADLYLQQGNTQAADVLANKTNYLPDFLKAKINAQLLSANGDNDQAIALLEKNLPAATDNESYRALLASLYHKTANYSQSVISYQRLLNSFGDKPAYWLGLALAYDGLVQPKNALQAYLHLREFPQLQDQVKNYTDQRIAALRSE